MNVKTSEISTAIEGSSIERDLPLSTNTISTRISALNRAQNINQEPRSILLEGDVNQLLKIDYGFIQPARSSNPKHPYNIDGSSPKAMGRG